MHKVILMVLLAAVSSSAMAGWVRVSESEDENITVYVNPNTIRKVGNNVKMWELGDYKTAKDSGVGTQYMSVKGQAEYNCKEEKYRTLYLELIRK